MNNSISLLIIASYQICIIFQLVSHYRCEQCRWPICQSDCKGLYQPYGHTMEECVFLLHISFDTEIEKDEINTYNFIVPLRCLLLKQTIPVRWETITAMESHNQIRQEIKSIWEFNETTVVEKLRNYFDSQEVHTICGVLEVSSQRLIKNVEKKHLFKKYTNYKLCPRILV